MCCWWVLAELSYSGSANTSVWEAEWDILLTCWPVVIVKLPTTVLYQVLNKQVPVCHLQVPVPVQVLCMNYQHSVTLQLHKVKVVVSFILKNEQLEHKWTSNTKCGETPPVRSVGQYGRSDLLHFKYTVNHKKGGSTFVTITLKNLDRFL